MADDTLEEIAHLEQIAMTLRRRLRVLDTQAAHYSPRDVSPHVVLEQEDIRRDLARTLAALRRLRPGPIDDRAPYLGLLTFQEGRSVSSAVGNVHRCNNRGTPTRPFGFCRLDVVALRMGSLIAWTGIAMQCRNRGGQPHRDCPYTLNIVDRVVEHIGFNAMAMVDQRRIMV
jgi:hypothetical protein